MKRPSTIFLCILLFAAGLGVMLYPAASNWLAGRNATRAIQQYNEAAAGLEEGDAARELARARAYNAQLAGYGLRDPFNPEEEFELPADYLDILNLNGVMGTLEIPKIDVALPIRHGVADEVLQRGVGHMQATAFPVGGGGSHAVLTGHRGLPSARLFTDLDKLEIGDHFLITVLDEVLCYEVDQILVVEPHETEALMPVQGEDYVTLITCTPYGINSHRMFVRGRRAPYTPETEAAIRAEAGGGIPIYVLVGIGIGIALITATLAVVLRARRRPRTRR